MLWLVSLAAFITTTTVILLLLSAPMTDVRKTRERLHRFVEATAPTSVEEELLAEARRRGKNQKGPLRQLLRLASRSLDSHTAARRLQAELEQADLLLKGSEFIVVQLAVAAGLGLAGLVLTKNPLAALGGLFVGYLLPRMYLKKKRTARQKAFGEQLAESLTVMANALKAGYSFLQAMEMVAKEMRPPIAVEFSRVLREVSLGRPTEVALEAMTKRVGSDDLDLVITCVLIQRQVGGNLAEILDSIAQTIRERIRIHGEIKTLTAQGRFSGMIVSLLPFALAGLLFAINRNYLTILFENPLGHVMLVAALISEGIGVFVIQKITSVEV